MTIEERVREFIDRMGINRDNVSNVHFAGFATQEVKAERMRVADELEALLGTAYESRQVRLTSIIRRLQNGGTE